ncbi:Signal transduction histidine kinase [Natronobacterium texcoconense]|uniref:histidine kinase n=2 Tax=Natronobacterium texcoconense TaxID=1095778 RepID=A0A1H1J2N0_NATTX|nr:Signal transduction histidine kinase [Natronobacterium texcoconense]
MRKRIVDALEPPYRVTTLGNQSLLEAVDVTVDCLVIAEGYDRSVIEELTTQWPDLPVFLLVSLSEDHDREWSVFRTGVDDLVYRGRRATDDPLPTRVRNRIDDCYEETISDVGETVLTTARSLLVAADDELDVEIEWGLEQVGTRLDADRCLVFGYDDETDLLEPTHGWVTDSRSAVVGPERLPAKSFPGFEDSLRGFDDCVVPSDDPWAPSTDVPDGFVGGLEDAETDANATHPYLERRDLEALLAVPIVVDWELTGVFVVGQSQRRTWPRHLRKQLRTFGKLVGYTLERRRQRRALVRRNERLERFASVVSHDLRNPLNVIAGSAELIAETDDPTYAENVLEAVDRMETLIDDLLLLAREGDVLGDLERVDLETLVEDAWKTVATPDATLETEGLSTLEADQNRLRQGLENLVRNAVEHNEPGVTVRVEGFETGFAVEDDGTGIAPENRERIFEEGYTDGGGTGLGLSIVDTVVAAHGWDISVTDGDLGGARFEIVTDPSPRANGA